MGIYLNMQQFLIEAEKQEVTKYLGQELHGALEGYTGKILLVGINCDKKQTDKPHSCVIEQKQYRSLIPYTVIFLFARSAATSSAVFSRIRAAPR